MFYFRKRCLITTGVTAALRCCIPRSVLSRLVKLLLVVGQGRSGRVRQALAVDSCKNVPIVGSFRRRRLTTERRLTVMHQSSLPFVTHHYNNLDNRKRSPSRTPRCKRTPARTTSFSSCPLQKPVIYSRERVMILLFFKPTPGAAGGASPAEEEVRPTEGPRARTGRRVRGVSLREGRKRGGG